MTHYDVIDLFSAAAGGWSLGMHRAGFRTVAACEKEAWRRTLYSENNPHVEMFDDICALSAASVVSRLGYFPPILVGSPPCQDISSANTKGKGVDGERSGLFFEAIRLIGEGRPRWFALENSPYLRTRGIDRIIDALEANGYASEPFVVGADDVGANHERKRVWILGFDPEQVIDAARVGYEGGWSWGRGSNGDCGAPDARCAPCDPWPIDEVCAVAAAVPDMGANAREPWADWNGGLTHHLHSDDGLSAKLADLRFFLRPGEGKTASASSYIVEALGDAVVPQIPEAIGRAILRTESALAAIYAQERAA